MDRSDDELRERHGVVLHVLDEALAASRAPASEFETIVTMLERIGTPHRSYGTHDGGTFLVSVNDVALFIFDGAGRCGRVLTER